MVCDRFQPETPPIEAGETCYHCENKANRTDVHCDYGQGLPHCDECAHPCSICKEWSCDINMKMNECLEYVCEGCLNDLQAEQTNLILQAELFAAKDFYYPGGPTITDEAYIIPFKPLNDGHFEYEVHIKRRQ